MFDDTGAVSRVCPTDSQESQTFEEGGEIKEEKD
jgi:hypothetical protein